MRSIKSTLQIATLCSFLFSALAHAATINGTVTDKTTSRPASGDTVELVDVQAGMSVAAKATTNSGGHFTLNKPGNGPYLVRVTHQGSPYFIAAPETGPADIPVYDAAPSVGGISIEADVIECEAENGQLRINERYFVHNTSSPPRTQYDPAHGFEIILPPDAIVDATAARRPTGLPTSTPLKAASEKSHFTLDFPIQPDEGDKDTLFQISYHLPYSSGKYTLRPQLMMRADNVAILLPKSIAFTGPGFQSVPQDPNIQTLLAKNVQPGQELTATLSGNGSMPREDQGQQSGPNAASQEAGSQDTSTPGTGPGGGIGQPINTPDPLTKYKWWILGALALALSAAAGFLLRRPAGAAAVPVKVSVPAVNRAPAPRRGPAAYVPPAAAPAPAPIYAPPPAAAPQSHNATLLTVLKEEMFAIESEKLSGTISAAEYKEQKGALETVLKRALSKK